MNASVVPNPVIFSPPAVVAPFVSADEAHGDMMTTSSELAELCQEPLTDMGLARITRLVAQMGNALNQTVSARHLEGVRAVA